MRWLGCPRKLARICIERSMPDSPFNAEVGIAPAQRGGRAPEGLRLVGIELIDYEAIDIEAGINTPQGVDEAGEIRRGTRRTALRTDFAGVDAHCADQPLRALTAILELTPKRLACAHRQIRRDALQGLDVGHLVDRKDDLAWVVRVLAVERADRVNEHVFTRIALPVQPVAATMGPASLLFSALRRWPADGAPTMPCAQTTAISSSPL